MSRAKTLSEVGETLHSVLESSKLPIPVKCLCSEYYTLMGEALPFAALGFQSIEDFVYSLRGVVRVFRSSGTLVCQAEKNQKTDHMSSLVSGQILSKSAKQRAAKSYRGKLAYGSSRRSSSYTDRPPSSSYTHSRTAVDSRPRPQSFPATSSSKSNYYGSSYNSYGQQSKKYVVPPRFTTQQSSDKRCTTSRPLSPQTMMPRPNRASVPPTDVPSWPADCTSTTSDRATANGDTKRMFDVRSGQITCTTCKISESNNADEAVSRFAKTEVGSKSIGSFSAKEAFTITIQNDKVDLSNKPKNVECENVDFALAANAKRKLLQLLDGRHGGLFLDYVESEYTERFRENLNSNWRLLIQDKNCFELDTTFNGRAILLGKIKSDEFIVEQTPVVPLNGTEPSDETVSSTAGIEPSNGTEPSDDGSESDTLIFSDDHVVDVFVTCATSTTDVWLRPEDVWSEHDELATAMELHYLRADDKTKLQRAETIAVGDMYATEADATCFRVQILAILSDDEFSCRYVDHGEVGTLSRSDLWMLEPKFKKPRFKTMQCHLHGLEGFQGCDGNAMVNIVSKTLVAKVVSRTNKIHSVVLTDTSSDDDLNVNDELRHLLLEEIRPPHLKSSDGGVNNNVYLCHNVGMGYIYLQVDSVTFGLLENLVDTAASCDDQRGLSSVSPNTIYLAKFTDDCWYRVVCAPGSVPDNEGRAVMFFVDYGNTDLVSLNDMISLKGDNDALTKLPYQAIRCRLQNVPNSNDLEWTRAASERVDQLAPDDLPLIAKVVPGTSSRDVPQVHLFKRTEPNNEIVSINDTLNFEQNLFVKKQTAGSPSRRKIKEHRGLNGADSCVVKTTTTTTADRLVLPNRDIEPLPFPSVGEQLDVYVTLAPNPYNFIVQSWLKGKQLDELVLNMNTFYEQEGRPVPSDHVVENGLYAVKESNVWYRVRVKRDGLSDLVSMYFIDYGDHTITSVDSLRILEDRFRLLPSQVIRAQLSDIEPIYGDWQSEDSVFFRELVQSKPFVAIAVGVSAAIDDTNERQLIVKLVDTSFQQDVYIHHVLIEKGIARLKTVGLP